MSELRDVAARVAPKPPAGVVVARLRDGAVEVATAGPVEPNWVFELGSITKAVTGLLLADAVVRGEVRLDTTLDDCLPGARPLRLADLASHTSGLPRLPLALLRRVGFTNTTDPYASTTVEELVEHLAGVRVRRPKLRYSNFGAALLGAALAARAGAPYEQLVEERVLRELGVTEVWAQDGPPVAQPHDRRGRPVQPWTFGAYAPAGCLRGTARGALVLSTACLDPPPSMAEAVALALTPRGGGRMMQAGLGWLRSAGMWWHNGGTNGSRSFTGSWWTVVRLLRPWPIRRGRWMRCERQLRLGREAGRSAAARGPGVSCNRASPQSERCTLVLQTRSFVQLALPEGEKMHVSPPDEEFRALGPGGGVRDARSSPRRGRSSSSPPSRS